MNKLQTYAWKTFIKMFGLKAYQQEQADSHILQINRLYATLSQINQTIIRVHDMDMLFGEICRIAVEYGKFRMAWIGLIDDTKQIVKPVAFAGEEKDYLTKIKIVLSDGESGKGPTGRAITEGRCILSQDIAIDPQMLPWRRDALKRGFRASAAVPIRIESKVIGAFMVYSSEPMVFDIKEQQLINEIGSDVSFALSTIEKEKQRMQTAEALRVSEEKYRKIFNNVQDVFYQTDSKGIITEISPSIFKLAGYQHEELIGKSVELFYYDQKERRIFLDMIASQNEVWDYEIRLLKKTGQVRYASMNAHKLLDAENNIVGIEGTIRDISDRKKFETDLISAKEKAEESEKLKTAFLHNISHEIRTPMNSIIGFASLLGEPGITPETQSSFIETIQGSSNQLLSIINDIVDISNIDANLAKIRLSQVSLNSELASLYKQFLPIAKNKNIQFTLETTLPHEKTLIRTDSTKLCQILTNLINNALKFTKQGQITFGYILQGQMLEFYVSDTGIGIPPDQHDLIFDRFYQVEHNLIREYEGTGLGLSICKGYIELLGGRIWLTSEPGKGTIFYFTLPYVQAKKPAFSESHPENSDKQELFRKLTFLIVEDDNNNYKLIYNLLVEMNADIIRARNGEEAVAKCREESNIDLVLMDIKIPLLDGYLATKQIRQFHPCLPVIAQTAYAGDREKALASGCSDFISKPFTKELLLSKIKQQLNIQE
jgi:PAS domain S-box-containing protein